MSIPDDPPNDAAEPAATPEPATDAPAVTLAPISEVDRVRDAAATAAADDPGGVMDAATDAFADLHLLTRAGERMAARGAAIAVQDLCLQLCVAPTVSAKVSGDKRRFVAIIIRWAWTRAPAVAAVLEASRQAERLRWGGDVGGAA